MRAAGGYEFDDDVSRIDLDALWDSLCASAYWGKWRSRDDVQRQVLASWRTIGCYTGSGAMVGFARAVSDGVALAYLADVYVLPEHRGQGLGRALVDAMIEQGPGQGFRWMLHTTDAQGLYRLFGFTTPSANYMERPSIHSAPTRI